MPQKSKQNKIITEWLKDGLLSSYEQKFYVNHTTNIFLKAGITYIGIIILFIFMTFAHNSKIYLPNSLEWYKLKNRNCLFL